jgi:IPT/TIG domain
MSTGGLRVDPINPVYALGLPGDHQDRQQLQAGSRGHRYLPPGGVGMLAVQWDFNPTGSTLIADLCAIGALVVAALRPVLTDRAPAPVGEIVIDDSSQADLSHNQCFRNLLAFGSKKAVERPKPRIRGLLPLEAPSGGAGVVSGENFLGGDEQPDKLLVLLGDQRVVPNQATPTAVQFRVPLGTSDGTVPVWERTSTGIYSAEDQAPSITLGHRVRKPRRLLSWLPRGNQASHTDPAGPGEGCTPVPSGRTTGADALRHPVSAPGTA